jgi:hypothetical protein
VSLPLESIPLQTRHPRRCLEGLGQKIEGRSLGQIAWMRLRRDKVAIGRWDRGDPAGCQRSLRTTDRERPWGNPPNEFHQDWSTTRTPRCHSRHGRYLGDFLFGVEPVNGRDLFSRVL